MSRRSRLDAVVAGGGVVGAATALMLAREGLQPLLRAAYEHVAQHQAKPPPPDPRFAQEALDG